MGKLDHSVLATIAWFDLFEYPLTAWEVGKWQIDCDRRGAINRAPTGVGVLDALQKLVTEGELGRKWGCYFLPGREEIVEMRQRRYLLASEKFSKARRVARWFRCVPFVRLVAVCNTLGYSNAAGESDIDLFIVAAPGRVWTVRGICLFFLKLFHLRPLLVRFGASHEERKDKIDLSFFVTDEALDISSLMLKRERDSHAPLGGAQNDSGSGEFPPDPYLSYWLTQLTPLWDHGGVYQKLWDANRVLHAPVPHAGPYTTSPLRAMKSSGISKFMQELLELNFSGGWVEPAFKSFQMKKMPARIKALAGHSDGVVISDTVLKFHDIDRRREYREKWLHRLSGLG